VRGERGGSVRGHELGAPRLPSWPGPEPCGDCRRSGGRRLVRQLASAAETRGRILTSMSLVSDVEPKALPGWGRPVSRSAGLDGAQRMPRSWATATA
jgi:hypothetical protein